MPCRSTSNLIRQASLPFTDTRRRKESPHERVYVGPCGDAHCNLFTQPDCLRRKNLIPQLPAPTTPPFTPYRLLFALKGTAFKKHSAVEAAVFRDLVHAGIWEVSLGEDYAFLGRLRYHRRLRRRRPRTRQGRAGRDCRSQANSHRRPEVKSRSVFGNRLTRDAGAQVCLPLALGMADRFDSDFCEMK